MEKRRQKKKEEGEGEEGIEEETKTRKRYLHLLQAHRTLCHVCVGMLCVHEQAFVPALMSTGGQCRLVRVLGPFRPGSFVSLISSLSLGVHEEGTGCVSWMFCLLLNFLFHLCLISTSW